MEIIMQEQRNCAQQIAAVIRNFRKVTTKTGKKMAVFTIGTIPAKCFDLTVDAAEHWAETGKKVLIAGQFSNHEGQIELVAQNINLVPLGQTDPQTGFSQGSYAGVSAQGPAPMRETSTIMENLSGRVSNIKTITTRSGRPMITFKIGNTSCKAFGELSGAIHKAEGKQIEVSARKGSFQSVTEYTIEILKTISGTAVDLRDTRTIAPEQHISKTAHTLEAINPSEEIDSDSFAQFVQRGFESGSPSSESIVAKLDREPPVNPGQGSSGEEQTELPTTCGGGPPGPVPIDKPFVLSASAIESMILHNVQWYRKSEYFPDKSLEKKLRSGSRYVSEAARRVLEERAKRAAADNWESEDFVQVEVP